MPDDPVELHADLGKLLEDQARHQEADAELSEAIKLQPEDAMALRVQRGSAYAHRGRWQNALAADYDKAIELSPNDAKLHNNSWPGILATHADPVGRDPGACAQVGQESRRSWSRREGALWNTLGIAKLPRW